MFELVPQRLALRAVPLDVAAETLQLFQRFLLVELPPRLVFLSWLHDSS